jgi:hypothetical protein
MGQDRYGVGFGGVIDIVFPKFLGTQHSEPIAVLASIYFSQANASLRAIIVMPPAFRCRLSG